MKSIIIGLLIFSTFGTSTVFSANNLTDRAKLSKKVDIKKPPHGDDGNGGQER